MQKSGVILKKYLKVKLLLKQILLNLNMLKCRKFIQAFWEVEPSRLTKGYICFVGDFCTHLQDLAVQEYQPFGLGLYELGSIFLRNIGKFLPHTGLDYTMKGVMVRTTV
jgi:hypothetical protein